MPITGSAERLTEAVDRLILKYRSVCGENRELQNRVEELEKKLEYQKGNADSQGYNLLRIHYARLLRERQEMKERLESVLAKLDDLRSDREQSANG
ncbi:MAG TPA: hypothetical protein PLM22_05670 [Candidatus Sabulitectum sp.]|nr:hypothetical protein [Candidatus Sabulitectum sp.]HPF33089.1 hypothetical protein [Candidatus Sabulitectum sp.]HPJ28402.1 hypothetical protein [Candidatus Sabulitectum sp.]HPR22175.1 hypothetical protein [Candidatus Sabulitectum sp.]